MTPEVLQNVAAAIALVALMLYAVLGGADFGGGIWDLFAAGPRKLDQRAAIAHAMGPVWEANHVWLIFVIVVLFTCFPYGYAPLGVALFLPFHLALLGIMLRGASFVFRGQLSQRAAGPALHRIAAWWGAIFGIASVISPVLLGLAFGTITEGAIRIGPTGDVALEPGAMWQSPYAWACGLLALSTCAYLAAVYLTVETQAALREDFRRRAIVAGTATAALAMIVLVLAWREAVWFFDRLTQPRSWPVLAAGLFCFAASAWSVFGRRYRLARIFSASEIALLLLGWGLAQHPYLVYPDLTFAAAAAPAPTIAFLVFTLPLGAALLVPSLWLLFNVFKASEK